MTSDSKADDPEREEAHRVHDRHSDFITYINEAAIKSGETALRSALLMNGGATIALLTFVGSLDKTQKYLVANTLVWFAWGVALAVIAMAFAYFTNYLTGAAAGSQILTWKHPYIQDGATTRTLRIFLNICQAAAVIGGLLAVLLFVVGMIDVKNAITKLN